MTAFRRPHQKARKAPLVRPLNQGADIQKISKSLAFAINIRYTIIVQELIAVSTVFRKEMYIMIAVNFATVQSKLDDYCDKVADGAETVIVTRDEEKNVVIISMDRYNEMEKAERNAAYIEKLERGLAQVHAGLGITKTMAELEAMVNGV